MKRSVEIGRIGEKTKFDQVLVHHRMATSHIGSFMLDLVKILAVAGRHVNKDKVTLLMPKEVVMRAEQITTCAFSMIEEKQWMAEIPAFADLLHKEDGKNTAGFRSVLG